MNGALHGCEQCKCSCGVFYMPFTLHDGASGVYSSVRTKLVSHDLHVRSTVVVVVLYSSCTFPCLLCRVMKLLPFLRRRPCQRHFSMECASIRNCRRKTGTGLETMVDPSSSWQVCCLHQLSAYGSLVCYTLVL